MFFFYNEQWLRTTSIEQIISLLNLTRDFFFIKMLFPSQLLTKALFNFGRVKYDDNKIDNCNWDSCKIETICPFTEFSFKDHYSQFTVQWSLQSLAKHCTPILLNQKLCWHFKIFSKLLYYSLDNTNLNKFY